MKVGNPSAAVRTALLAAGLAVAMATTAAAHALSVRDEGHLHLVRSSGAVLVDEGAAHGTIPGSAWVSFVYNGNPSVSAKITIDGSGGSVSAHGSALLSNPNSTSPSFSGSLSITGGSGRYAHAHGGGHLYGVFYRRSYALVVQTDGTLDY